MFNVAKIQSVSDTELLCAWVHQWRRSHLPVESTLRPCTIDRQISMSLSIIIWLSLLLETARGTTRGHSKLNSGHLQVLYGESGGYKVSW